MKTLVKAVVLLAAFALILVACTKQESAPSTEVIKFTEAELVDRAKLAAETYDLVALDESISALQKEYPSSQGIKSAGNLKAELEAHLEKESLFREERRLRQEAEAEKKKTGVWTIVSYTDDFGEPTNDRFIWNRDYIEGKFSNTATQNSDLNVRFLIDGPNEVDIKLYEYARSNPVKAYAPDKYIVRMRDKNGKDHDLFAINRGDRLSFGPKHSRIVYDALKTGGTVKFSIYEEERPTNRYSFNIPVADYFDNTARMLNE